MFNSLYESVIRGRDYTDATKDPIISASVAYGAADAVGGLIVFNGVTRQKGGSGRLGGITIIDKKQIKAALKLWLFDQPVTVAADNAAFAISDADMEHFIGVIATSTYTDVAATSSIYHADFTPILYRAIGTRAIYGQLVCTATPTYTGTDDLVVKLHVDIVN